MAEENKRVNSLEQNMAGINKDIGYIKDSLEDNKKEHREIIEMLRSWRKEAEKNFANKWVEKLLIWGGGVIGIAILGAIMSLIIK